MVYEVMISPGKQYFSINLKYLFITGLWPLEEYLGKWSFLYKFYQHIFNGLGFIYIILASMGCYQVRRDFIYLIGSLVKTLVGYNYFFKAIFFIQTWPTLKDLIDDIMVSGDKITEKRNKTMSTLIIGITSLTLSVMTSFCLLSLYERKLVVELWFPFDVNKNLANFLLANQLITVMFIILQCRAVAMQGIVSSLIMYTCDQLSELQQRLRALEYYPACENDMKKEFKSIVKKHVRLRRYGETMNKVFKNFFFIQNLAVTAEMCLNAVMVTAAGSEQKKYLVSFAAFLLLALLNEYIFCYLADELITMSTGIADAAYESKWILWPIYIQKDLITIITVAQRPMSLSAGGMALMSIQTFAQTLYNGYSVFAFLQDAVNR